MIWVSLLCILVLTLHHNVCYSSIFGFTGSNSVVLSSSGSINVHNVMMKSDFEWLRQYDNVCVCLQGSISDCEHVFSLIDYHTRQSYDTSGSSKLSAKSIAYLCRNAIGSGLRTDQLKVNGLVGGIDEVSKKPVLYWFDNLGALQKVSHAAHGPDFPNLLAQLEYQKSLRVKNGVKYKGDMVSFGVLSDADVKNIVNSCWNSVKVRSLGQTGLIITKVLDRDGIKSIT